MNNKIKTLKELKSSGYKALGIKDEMKKGLENENYFTEEERVLFSTFIEKIRNELKVGK